MTWAINKQGSGLHLRHLASQMSEVQTLQFGHFECQKRAP
jgi:hypothetical protein